MSSSSSEDESNSVAPVQSRLGTCEACNVTAARYSCPKCEVKTCSIACTNLHKRELKCDGVRDRTKFIPLNKMTKMDLMNDYYFLEECTRYVEDRKQDKGKYLTQYNKMLPPHLFRLRDAALKRKTTLRFLLKNFTKRQKNKTQLDYATKTIWWRVEWCFPNGAETLLFVDERVNENAKLYELLSKYLDPESHEQESVPERKKLQYYQSRGITGVRVLLKAEGIKRCKNRFFELDTGKSLCECLAQKTVVEFPTVYVVLRETVGDYDVIDSDEDIEQETRQYQQYMDAEYGQRRKGQPQRKDNQQEQEAQVVSGIDSMKIVPKQQKCPSKKQEHSNKEQTNFLFTDESLWNELSSGTEIDTEEEQMDTESTKRAKLQ